MADASVLVVFIFLNILSILGLLLLYRRFIEHEVSILEHLTVVSATLARLDEGNTQLNEMSKTFSAEVRASRKERDRLVSEQVSAQRDWIDTYSQSTKNWMSAYNENTEVLSSLKGTMEGVSELIITSNEMMSSMFKEIEGSISEYSDLKADEIKVMLQEEFKLLGN